MYLSLLHVNVQSILKNDVVYFTGIANYELPSDTM